MNRRRIFLVLAAAGGFCLALMPARAAEGGLSAERFDALDRETGLFTPNFKAALHDLVNAKETIATAEKESKELNLKLPDLQKQAADADAHTIDLRKKLAEYDHTDEADFVELQKAMSDAGADPEDQRVKAQTYVWAYPSSPHQAEAQEALQTAQKKLDALAQARKDAAAAVAAAQAKLLQRVQAKELNLTEWREFLQDKSQEEVVRYLGRPQSSGVDSWIYANWMEDPIMHQKIGMRINFNAGRVNSVTEAPQ